MLGLGLGTILQIGGQATELNIAHNYREEERTWYEKDKEHRRWEVWKRKIDDIRRQIDGKSQQLKALANVSALVAGFAMVVLVQIVISAKLNVGLLVCFATTSSVVVCTMLYVTLSSTLMLVAVLDFTESDQAGRCNYDFEEFQMFWKDKVHGDFVVARHVFMLGAPMFLATLAETGFVVYNPHISVLAVGSVQATIAAIGLFFWFKHIAPKWGTYGGTRDTTAPSSVAHRDVGPNAV